MSAPAAWWKAILPAAALVISAAARADAATVSGTPTSTTTGSTLTVTWDMQGRTPVSTDWVGLFAVGSANTSTRYWWAYTSGTATGTRTLSGPSFGGTYEFRLFASNSYTLLATSAPITVTAVPVTASLTPSATSVAAGGALSVSWSMSGRTPSGTDWIGLFVAGSAHTSTRYWWQYTGGTATGTKSLTAPTTSGNYEFRLFASNTYTLLATSAPVTVGGGGGTTPTATLSASPLTITSGQSSTLTWSSTNATSCTASGGWTGTKAVSGTQSVSPAATTTYSLTCTGAGGTSPVRSVTVTVSGPVTATVTGSPASVATGGALSVSWSMSGRTPTSTDWIGLFRVGSANTSQRFWWQYTGGTASGTKTLTAPTTANNYEFRLFASNSYTLLATSAPITVGSAAPTATLTANPTTIVAGGSSTLTWSSTNATSCTASGGWSGSKATSGTQSVSPAATTTYSLTCTGASGTSPAASATVTVNTPVVPIHNFRTGTEVYHYVNLAWGRYFRASDSQWVQTFGMDFGACPLLDARRLMNNAQVALDLDALDQRGVQGVRWWVIPDGRNLTFNSTRTATGRGTGFRDDLHRALDLLSARNMGVIITLFDGNTWFQAERTYQNALFGHAQSIQNATKRQALYNTVVIPILRDLADWAALHPTQPFPVTAIDIINEPYFGSTLGQPAPQTGTTMAQMQTLVREVAALVRQHLPGVPVTVGEARPNLITSHWTDSALGVSAGQGLDFYSFHHFGTEPLEGPGSVRALHNLDQLGKRVYLQEFPTKNPALWGPQPYLAAIGGTRGVRVSTGWLAGSFPWSFTARGDAWTADDPLPVLNDIQTWYSTAFDRPDLAIGPVVVPPMQSGVSHQFVVPVVNQGGATAPSNRIELWLDGTMIHSATLPTLQPGQIATVTAPAWTSTGGGHSLWAKADVFLQIDEPDEANNERTTLFTVFSGPMPDLTIGTVSPSSGISAGQSVTFSIQVRNIGTASAGSHRLEGWLDGVLRGAVTVPAIAAGGTTTVTLPVWTATSGGHALWVKADIFEVINEFVETNNERNTAFNVP